MSVALCLPFSFFFFAFGGHARALFMEFGVDIGKSGLLATFQGFPKRNLIRGRGGWVS
jgi:hypothetical protein